MSTPDQERALSYLRESRGGLQRAKVLLQQDVKASIKTLAEIDAQIQALNELIDDAPVSDNL